MALITKGCYAIVMGFDRPAFTVTQLIGMSRDYSSVFNLTMLAGALANNL
jgi:hypothetical protein